MNNTPTTTSSSNNNNSANATRTLPSVPARAAMSPSPQLPPISSPEQHQQQQQQDRIASLEAEVESLKRRLDVEVLKRTMVELKMDVLVRRVEGLEKAASSGSGSSK